MGLRLVFAGAIGLLGAPDVPVEVDEGVEFYEVAGRTSAELTAQMAQQGPAHFGGRAWALTAWEIRALYVLVPDAAGCRIGYPRVRLEIVTTLPRWTPPPGTPWRLRASWQTLLTRVGEHEDVHRDHAQAAAHRTATAVAALPLAADCAEAERQVREALRREVMYAQRQSTEFDRVTGFGALEGVGLDP